MEKKHVALTLLQTANKRHLQLRRVEHAVQRAHDAVTRTATRPLPLAVKTRLLRGLVAQLETQLEEEEHELAHAMFTTALMLEEPSLTLARLRELEQAEALAVGSTQRLWNDLHQQCTSAGVLMDRPSPTASSASVVAAVESDCSRSTDGGVQPKRHHSTRILGHDDAGRASASAHNSSYSGSTADVAAASKELGLLVARCEERWGRLLISNAAHLHAVIHRLDAAVHNAALLTAAESLTSAHHEPTQGSHNVAPAPACVFNRRFQWNTPSTAVQARDRPQRVGLSPGATFNVTLAPPPPSCVSLPLRFLRHPPTQPPPSLKALHHQVHRLG